MASIHLFVFKERLEKFISSQPLTIRKKKYGVYVNGRTSLHNLARFDYAPLLTSKTKSRSSTFFWLEIWENTREVMQLENLSTNKQKTTPCHLPCSANVRSLQKVNTPSGSNSIRKRYFIFLSV